MPARIPEIFLEGVTKLSTLSVCENWNHYENFFVFLSRSLRALYRSGMVRNLDSWLIADLADTAHKEASGACHDKELKKSKQLAEALIHRARREAIQHRDFFESMIWILV